MKEKIMKIILNKNLCLKILAGIIIIIAILVVTSCVKKTEYGNSNGNNNNLGLAVEKGKWIYYINMDDNEPVGIAKVKNNGKKTEKVIDGNIYGLNIIDNYIYCVEYDEDDSQYNLIKVKTNGKNKEILARNIDESPIMAVNKWIYYQKNRALYRVRTNGTNRENVSNKNISYYHIDNDWIYYIYKREGSQYIAKMKIDGEKSEKISKAEDNMTYESLYVKGGKVYFIVAKQNENYDSTYYLYKMNKKGSNKEQICKIDANCIYFNMQENAIYYTITEDYNEYTIKYIKYNGTGKTIIKETKASSYINITKDWIFSIGVDSNLDSVTTMISIKGDKEKEL